MFNIVRASECNTLRHTHPPLHPHPQVRHMRAHVYQSVSGGLSGISRYPVSILIDIWWHCERAHVTPMSPALGAHYVIWHQHVPKCSLGLFINLHHPIRVPAVLECLSNHQKWFTSFPFTMRQVSFTYDPLSALGEITQSTKIRPRVLHSHFCVLRPK
jgi:hypothetical protein